MNTHDRVAVLITCHNRKAKTLESIASVFNQTAIETVKIRVYLVDDGSSDGTTEAVHNAFPQVTVLSGDGNLYWNGGMRLAFESAVKDDNTFFLWLNDDTTLFNDALSKLLDSHCKVKESSGNEAIVVGSTRSVDTNVVTYGGVIRTSRIKRLKFTLVTPGSVPIECETMNGNCVLIPRKIVDDIGNLDSTFTHSMGDFDYGLRARSVGYGVWICPQYVGLCIHNSVKGTYHDKQLSMFTRLRLINTIKGRPFKEWLYFSRKYGGLLWFYYIFSPYIRVVISSIINR